MPGKEIAMCPSKNHEEQQNKAEDEIAHILASALFEFMKDKESVVEENNNAK